jgi:hypothetical protein
VHTFTPHAFSKQGKKCLQTNVAKQVKNATMQLQTIATLRFKIGLHANMQYEEF